MVEGWRQQPERKSRKSRKSRKRKLEKGGVRTRTGVQEVVEVTAIWAGKSPKKVVREIDLEIAYLVLALVAPVLVGLLVTKQY